MEQYSAMRKREILPFVTSWIDFEDIMLNEIRQRQTYTSWYNSHVESKKKKANSQKQRVKRWLPWAGGGGGKGGRLVKR